MSERSRSIYALFAAVGICLVVGIAASVVTASSIKDWYPLLEKPSWTPPNWLFGPVWSALYVMMGVAAWLVWRDSTGTVQRRVLLIFASQLILNCIWSFLFFGLRSPGWAVLEIVLLWSMIVVTMFSFAKINRLAAGLLVPYVVWVSFAAALNFAVWNLNR